MASHSIALDSNRSTGPRTPEGKARSSQNARKHGFSAKTLDVLPAEQADFEIYQNELLETVKPQPGPQSDLFHQLLHAGWSLRRLARFELEILAKGNPFESPETQSQLDRLERYRSAHRRAYPRLLDQIRKLQTSEMLWNATHDLIQDQASEHFPMADPAARSLNRQLRMASEFLTLEAKLNRANAEETRAFRQFYKTNSPGTAPKAAFTRPSAHNTAPAAS